MSGQAKGTKTELHDENHRSPLKAGNQNADEQNSAMNSNPTGQQSREDGARLLSKKLFKTKLSIFLENLWLKSWAPLIIIMGFVLVSLYDLWPLLSPLMHRLILALFLLAFIASFIPYLYLKWPKEKEALKRLDKHSTLPHQPAQAFKDQLAPDQANETTRSLWLQFKERLLAKIKNLKVPPPHPKTASKDPYALRMVMLLAIAVGLFIQTGNIKALLLNGVTLPAYTNPDLLRVDAWVTPPIYTKEAPSLISNGKTEEKQEQVNKQHLVPQNSILTIRVNGKNATNIELNPGKNPKDTQNIKKQKRTNAKTIANKNRETKDFQIKLQKDGPVILSIDKVPFKSWKFKIKPDLPPIIGLIEQPSRAQTGALKLKYRVVDDYGVISAKAHLNDVSIDGKKPLKVQDEKERPLGSPPEFALNLEDTNLKSAKGETYKDLKSHPWAGLFAKLHLSATDEAGNTSNSPTLAMKIPEFKFTKPMAKNLIRFRKQLIITPHESAYVARALYTLTAYEENFKDDYTLYLGVRIAALRLRTAGTRNEKEDIAKLLYELARHAEDGDLSKAEEELRTAQEALRKALQENASPREIEKRIEELRKALQKYMQALAKQQNQQAQNNNQKGKNNDVNAKDFEQMLKTIEELAKLGSKNLAQQMLNQMQNMLENLQTGKNQNNKAQSQTAKDLEELGKLLQEQQKLMDKTFNERRKQNQQNNNQRENQQQGQRKEGQLGQQKRAVQQGQQPGPSLSEQQQALREKLEGLMRQMRKQRGQESQSLDNAGKAMGRAGERLEQKDFGNALSEEGQAMDQLRRGMEQLSKQMGQANSGQGGGRKEGGRDPLGRSQDGFRGQENENVNIPDKADFQRTREILRRLREKIADPNRPAQELEYYERLLKRF